MSDRSLLLINPWIADFTAFDLWSKPLGLLYIAKFLQNYGYEIELLDLMDRQRWQDTSNDKFNDGRGKYRKTIIAKPPVLARYPRRFGLYGASREQFSDTLSNMARPNAILVTSLIAYWYPGVAATVEILRRYFPETPLILGGIYASLYPEHARNSIQPDFLITGYGEKKTLQLVDQLFGIERDYNVIPDYNDNGILPWRLYQKLKSVAVLTSRGCPNRCTYCATYLLNKKFVQRRPEDVISEIISTYNQFNVENFAFYDDALFAHRDRHIIPILKGIISAGVKINLHSPNGLFAREINSELAELMFSAGFKTVRLSLESTSSQIQKSSSNKVNNANYTDAVNNLAKAGFARNSLETYLIMGLPGQTRQQIIDSINFVADQGVIVKLASFSPIPGTTEWERARALGYVSDDQDPLMTDATIFPFLSRNLSYEDYLALRQVANERNTENRSNNQISNEASDGTD
ncbi:MAG TPA: radical SAM protein [Candidatus Marinimicrobia bacterium]|nr:radical SAM protein [Candidatus Neomarinimicrobiota bacterium]HPN74391.1 radical SAM protein [Candidatus Neomarinimicrobiota bacterium]HQO73900.1 radical SAM protein [Candidatus Neomarinimicrobiota bacterium]